MKGHELKLALAMISDISVDRKNLEGMSCQLCVFSPATCRVTQREADGRSEEGFYCSSCYEAKYVKPPPTDQGVQRLRFTIKALMILVVVFSIPNAIAAWILRSLSGTPQQIREWSVSAFLGINLILGFLIVWLFLQSWLEMVSWYNRTGGLVPMPKPPIPDRMLERASFVRTLPVFLFAVVAIVLIEWIGPGIWLAQRGGRVVLLALILVPAFALFALSRLLKDRGARNRFRHQWTMLSRAERVIAAVRSACGGGVFLAMIFRGGDILAWMNARWFHIPIVIAIVMVAGTVLNAVSAFSARRR